MYDNSPEIPQHYTYKGLDEPKPNRPANPIGPDGLPQYFSYKPFDYPNSPGMRQKDAGAPADGTTAAPEGATAPEGIPDTPPAGSTPGTPVTIDPANWEAALDAGNYDAVGAAVTKELRSLGASDAEVATAQNLCNLASERRADPGWRKWSKDMLGWIRGLRPAR